MLIIKIFFGIYITCFISYAHGHIFNNILKIKNNFFESLIIGFFILGFFGILINFFYPINYIINNIILLISIVILLHLILKKKLDLKIFKYFFFISTLSIILVLYSNFQEDYPWYNLPFISLLNNEKISFGISNVQFRFGHISILQYTSAILPNLIINQNLLILPNLMVPTVFMVWVIDELIFKKKKKFSLANNFLFFVAIFFLTKFTRFSEFGNDVPAHTLIFIIMYNILKLDEKSKDFKIDNKFFFNKILIFSIFAIMQKIQYFMIILLPMCFALFYFRYNIIQNYKFLLISSIIIFAWCSKNFIHTGCILYPNEITCFENVSWSANNPQDHSNPRKVYDASSAWSKGWPDQTENILNHSDYNKNFNWISTWYNHHGLLIGKKLLPFIIISSFIILYSNFKSKGFNFKIFRKQINRNKYIIIYLIFCLLVWLNIFPMFRYNTAFIVSLCAILLGILLNTKINYSVKEFKLLLAICVVFICSKNLLRISNDYGQNNIFPKIKSDTTYKVFQSNGYKMIKPNKGGCFYVNEICSHHGHQNNIEIINFKNYKFYINKR